jgi:tRNA(adenine34) deaminase
VDEAFMRRCLELAQLARERGETAVGAVLVRDTRIIAEGAEDTRAQLDPSAHAEVVALRAACQGGRSSDLSGSTLYTTVEPCVLCAYVIRRTRVSRVVYGVPAGEAGGITSRYALLADAELEWSPPPEIVAGVLAAECGAMLRRRVAHP